MCCGRYHARKRCKDDSFEHRNTDADGNDDRDSGNGDNAADAAGENTVPEVTQLITEYYNAAAAGDMDTINSIVNTYDQETQIYLQKMSEHIEAYQNVVCYTKTGPVDGSYLVYA